ncbi:hypothetical protein B0J18DRAFT_421105 [Chaetomium sp. MPI-SDFR-AT-0129]|nr:hypothetical protein B0J18DRAFT_421105 [Chaetomium sp. MPI-SDFR-AT-0129]
MCNDVYFLSFFLSFFSISLTKHEFQPSIIIHIHINLISTCPATSSVIRQQLIRHPKTTCPSSENNTPVIRKKRR